MSIKKHIPNTITCCNLISGCIATSFAFGGSPKLALLWIIIGAMFDFFDGMSARLLHVSSPIGKELDSLADDVTFGVAPATIVFSQLYVMEYPSFLESLRPVLPYAAFIIAAFSALRLAKFNLDERQSTSFIGVPTPANALAGGSQLLLETGDEFFVECQRALDELHVFHDGLTVRRVSLCFLDVDSALRLVDLVKSFLDLRERFNQVA